MNLDDIFKSRLFSYPTPEELNRQKIAFAMGAPEDREFEDKRQILQKLACIDGLFRDEIEHLTFSSFNPRRDIVVPKNLADSWTPDLPQGIFFYGSVGLGKSHLMTALCVRWASRHREACFKRLSDLLAAFKSNFDGLEDAKTKLKTIPLLFIDDIGAEQGSAFAEDQIFQILDYRSRYKGHTFGSSNLDPEHLERKYHPRIVDRLRRLCSFVELRGDSYRKIISKKQDEALYARLTR